VTTHRLEEVKRIEHVLPVVAVRISAGFLDQCKGSEVDYRVRPGDFEGVVIANDKLIEVATCIRDELGYDYLTNLTGVDYLAQNEMEVVYHALHTRAGGAPLVFKARTPRDNAVVPSLIVCGGVLRGRRVWT
jgi:NADH:ubiquinone oxidoreductase subunit C